MTQAVAEVPEVEAEGKIKSTYDDIKATFRVPHVGQVFRELATQPDYLQTAWVALKPNVQIVYFERQADTLRRAAVEAAGGFGNPPALEDSVRRSLTTLHYATPKFFLATAILRTATAGSQPQMLVLPARDKRQIPPGAPADMQPVRVDGNSTVDEQVDALLRDMRHDDVASEIGDVGPGIEFRALAGSPEYLQSAVQVLAPLAGRADFLRTVRTVRLLGERTVTALPFRLDIGPHTLRHSGLTEQGIDDVQDILNRAYAREAAALLSTAFLALSLGGREQASLSPFPLAEDAS